MFFSIRPETPRVAFVRIFTATTLALALFLAVQAPASAAPICATHKEVTEQLANAQFIFFPEDCLTTRGPAQASVVGVTTTVIEGAKTWVRP